MQLTSRNLNRRILSALLGLCSITSMAAPLAAGDKKLLVPAVVNGKQSSIYQKVVVTSFKAQLRPQPGGEGQFIEPFSIFFKMKADGGALETQGHVRVGDSEGNPLGWIDKKDLAEWNTRFVLEPLEPSADKSFVVNLAEGNRLEMKVVPSGKRRFAFITGASTNGSGNMDDTGPFPVIVCTAEVRKESARSFTDELNDLRNMKLEIMFVLEGTDFMINEYDGKPLSVYMFDLAQELVKTVKSDSQLVKTKGVRFGIAEYQDTTKLADFVSRIQQPLTDNMDMFLDKLKSMKMKAIEGDWPDDVIAGLNTAMKEATWSENSIKHIILIGQASMQIEPKGIGANQFGGEWNSVVKEGGSRSNPDTDSGWNSSGLSIERLIQLANPEGGAVEERAKAQMSFHAMWIGEPIEDVYRKMLKEADPSIDADAVIKTAYDMVKRDDAYIEQMVDKLGPELVGALFRIPLAKHQNELAQKQYRQLTANRDRDGYYKFVRPNAKDLKTAALDLTSKLKETVDATAKIRRGEIQDPSALKSDNPILERYYTVVGASAERLKDQPVHSGTAAVRDARGRSVAQKKVLVTREELVRLKSTFDAIQTTFKKMSAKVDRQDVSSIIDKLKRSLAGTTTGQEISADTPLKDFLTDLPLKTNALDVTAGDIAVMSSDAFSQWLNKLEASQFRIQDLLERQAEWMALNEKAENDRFTFLHLSELP